MGDGRPRPSGVGDHGEPVAAQPRLGGVDPAVGVKVFDGMATDDPGLPEDAFVENIGAGQGAGVAEARPGAGGRSAHVLGEDRLQRRDPPGGFDEPPAVADPLDVKDDRLRLFVRAQIFEDVDEADIGLVSAADRLAEADSPLLEVGERLGDVGAAL